MSPRSLPRFLKLVLGTALTVLVAGVVASSSEVLGTPSASAAEPGLNVGGNFFSSTPTFNAITQSGARYVRFFMFWSTIEPSPGRYDEGTLKAYERALSNLPPGTRALIVVVGAPSWANGSSDIHAPPRDPADYARFVHYLAGRFAGRVAAWEIWNEADAPTWWTGNAAQYTALLRAAYPAIKSADSGAQVVLGGLTGNNFHFLQTLYADGAKGSFDVVSDHTDTACNLNPPSTYFRDGDGRINQYSFLGYREVHAVMLANGDNKPIWLSEMGWNTSSLRCDGGAFKNKKAGGVSEATQAAYLLQAYHCLAGDPYVQVAFWFDLQDQTVQDSSQGRYGLLRPNYSRKPAFDAFHSYTQDGDQIKGACGSFTGPRVTIASPRDGGSYAGPLPISVRASSPVGVFEIQLRYDSSNRIRNFVARGPRKPSALSGFINWMGAKHISPGRHTLSVRAIDPIGNSTTQTITFIHMGTPAHRKGKRRLAPTVARACSPAAAASDLVGERQLAGQLAQARRLGVATGGRELEARGPGDANLGVVVGDPALELGVVVGGLLVDQIGHLADRREPMGEADGDVDLVLSLVVELERLPLTERRRARAHVDDHVEDRAARAADQLGHPVADVEVHAAHHAAARARLVVLDELVLDPQVREDVAAVGLGEEAALVAVDGGGD